MPQTIEYTYSSPKNLVRTTITDPLGLRELNPHSFSPVREIHRYHHMPSRPGMAFMDSLGSHVECESSLEFHYLLEFDRDINVTGVVSQPFRMVFDSSTPNRDHVPDFLLQLEGHEFGMVVNIKPDSTADDIKVRKQLEIAEEWADYFGFAYATFYDPHPARRLNIRFLSGFRRVLPNHDEVAPLVLDAVAEPAPIREVEQVTAAVSGLHVLQVRPYVMRMLWDGMVSTNLDAPLSDASVLTVGGAA